HGSDAPRSGQAPATRAGATGFDPGSARRGDPGARSAGGPGRARAARGAGRTGRSGAAGARASSHPSPIAPPPARGAAAFHGPVALPQPALRGLVALGEAALLLSMSACASTGAMKAPPPTDYSVTVKSETASPTAPTPGANSTELTPELKKAEEGLPMSPAPSAPPAPADSKATVIPLPAPGAPASAKPAEPPSIAVDERRHPVVRIPQAQTPVPGQPTPQSPGRLVVFNFDNADIEIVLQATSELLVFNYVLSPGARGKKVTVQTTGRIPVDDIFPVLLTILDVNGLAAVKSGNLWRIIPKEGAVQTSTRTIVGVQMDAAVPGDEVVTQIVPLQFTSATDVLNLVRPFVPPQGAITATRDTNLLVITDVAANIRRLLDMIKLVDVDQA